MRLIDAETFPNELKEMMIQIDKNSERPEEDWFLYGFDEFVIALDVIDLVKEMPTVEAIPIEWIKNWIRERNGFPTMPYNQHIWDMLDDWEKENGRSE